MYTCQYCGQMVFRPYEPKPCFIMFFHDEKIETALAVPENDSFYRITKGKYKDNLVHVFDIVRKH